MNTFHVFFEGFNGGRRDAPFTNEHVNGSSSVYLFKGVEELGRLFYSI